MIGIILGARGTGKSAIGMRLLENFKTQTNKKPPITRRFFAFMCLLRSFFAFKHVSNNLIRGFLSKIHTCFL